MDLYKKKKNYIYIAIALQFTDSSLRVYMVGVDFAKI